MHIVMLGDMSDGGKIDSVKGKPSQEYDMKNLCIIFYFSCEVQHVEVSVMGSHTLTHPLS